MIIRKMVGITLFFAGVALWGIILICLLFWAIPFILLVFCAGWLTHARPWPELKNFAVWEWIRKNVFNFKLYGAANIPDSRGKIIWAIYPHGHFALTGVFYWALNPRFSAATAAVHSTLFYIPLMSTFVRWIGAIGVTEKEMTTVLNDDGEIYMYPGGVADMSYEGNEYKKRRGFLRIARETQSRVIPVWCPNERSYYSQWLPWGRCLESFFGFPVPMFIFGRWWCPLLPKHVEESKIMIGEPIPWELTPHEHEERFADEIKKLQAL